MAAVQRNDETGEVRDEPIGWFHFWMILKINSPYLFPDGDLEPKTTGHSVPWRQYGAEGHEPVLQFSGWGWMNWFRRDVFSCVFSIIHTSYIHIIHIYILGVAKTLGLPWVCRRWACQVSGLRMGAVQCPGYLGAVGKVGDVFKGMAYWFHGNLWEIWWVFLKTMQIQLIQPWSLTFLTSCESGGSLPPRHVGYPSEVAMQPCTPKKVYSELGT